MENVFVFSADFRHAVRKDLIEGFHVIYDSGVYVVRATVKGSDDVVFFTDRNIEAARHFMVVLIEGYFDAIFPTSYEDHINRVEL